MSMRVSGGEENASHSPGAPEDKACKPVTSLAEPCRGMTVGPSSASSPLLGLLACRELLPQVLEHEKALLVMKEHDYAKSPYRPEILQLSLSLQPTREDGETVEEGEESCPANRTLLNCRNDLLKLRESVGSQCEPVVTSHFREVVGLQVALLREQQEQLYHKDSELNAMRKEKEQLEARLERMERRLAILQRQSRSKSGYDAESPHTPENLSLHPPTSDSSSTPRQTRLPRRDSLINSERHGRNRSSSVDFGSKRHRPRLSSRASTPLQDDKEVQSPSVKRSHKRKLSDTGQNDVKKSVTPPKSPAELRTDKEYTGLGLPLPKRRNLSNSNSTVSEGIHQNSVDGSSLSNSTQSVNSCGKPNEIAIPSWKVLPVKASLSGDLTDCEDLADEVFLKRHKKLEEDEKRRKRWDIQRARSLFEHEELLRKYQLKSAGGQTQEKKKEKCTTLLPKVSEIEAIEVMDTVVVSAFGRPIPLLNPSEFELPWFDLDVREAKESVRTTRSRAKATKTSTADSSAEES